MKRALAFCFAGALLAAGCAALAPADCTALPGGGAYCLQPAGGVPPLDLQQKVEVSFAGQTETLITSLEVDGAGMRFAGLTPFGQKVLQVGFDNRAVQVQQMPAGRLDPALLLALLQISLWPEDAVRRGLAAPLTLEQTAQGRTVRRAGSVLMAVRWDGATPWPHPHVAIELPAAGLILSIDTL